MDPAISKDELAYYLSIEHLVMAEDRIVPKSYHCQTSDKAVFYHFCNSVQLPIPEIYGVFAYPSGWSSDGTQLTQKSDWETFFQNINENFIVKPALGMIGQGVNAFKKNSQLNTFTDHSSVSYSFNDLYNYLDKLSDYNIFATGQWGHGLGLRYNPVKTIIQEQLYSCKEIVALTGSKSISTYRIITLVTEDKIHIICGAFRIVRGNNLTDNFSSGKSGNLWSTFCTKSGKILNCYELSEKGDRYQTVDRIMPDGPPIDKIKLPYLADTIELALRAAKFFMPQPQIAWDIAITDDGPKLIEGNIGWGILPSPMEMTFHEYNKLTSG